MTTVEQIMQIVSRISRKPITDPKLSLRTDVKMDSLDIVDVMNECEDTFNVTLADNDLKGCDNLQDVADVVERKMKAS